MQQLMMKSSLLLCGLMAFSSQLDAATETENKAPLAAIFGQYSKYLALSEKDKAVLGTEIRILSKTVKPADIFLSFEFQNKTYEIRPDKNSRITFRPTQAMLDENPLVSVNQPKGTLGLSLNGTVKLPQVKSLPIEESHTTIHQAWKIAKSFAGAFSFLAPKYAKISVEFDTSCQSQTWSVQDEGNKVIAKGTAEDLINFKSKKIRRAKTIEFGCTPTGYYFR